MVIEVPVHANVAKTCSRPASGGRSSYLYPYSGKTRDHILVAAADPEFDSHATDRLTAVLRRGRAIRITLLAIELPVPPRRDDAAS